MNTRRVITLTILLALLAFGVVSCIPENDVDQSTKVTPIEWLNEDELFVRIGNNYFTYDGQGDLAPSSFDAASSSNTRPLGVRLTPVRTNQIWGEDGHEYIELEGDKQRIGRPSYGSDRYGMNQGFPREEFVDFYVYRHLGKVGLVTFDEPEGRKTELPIQHASNTSTPVVKRDNASNMFFAFQNQCSKNDADGTCTRSAWWISSDLEVTSSFLLPIEDPYFAEEKLSCFSCGCGCYTHQDVYVVNDQVFFHFAGFPIKNSKSGLYRVVDIGSGKTEWHHEIKGRMEPPLAFTPSGCKVAYFRVSRFGDELQVQNLCE